MFLVWKFNFYMREFVRAKLFIYSIQQFLRDAAGLVYFIYL